MSTPSPVAEHLCDDPLPLVRLLDASSDLGSVETQTVLMIERTLFRPSMVTQLGRLGARFAHSTDDRFLLVALSTSLAEGWLQTRYLSQETGHLVTQALAPREAGVVRVLAFWPGLTTWVDARHDKLRHDAAAYLAVPTMQPTEDASSIKEKV